MGFFFWGWRSGRKAFLWVASAGIALAACGSDAPVSRATPSAPVCGDGSPGGDEICDDGPGGYCSDDCRTILGYCGDGVLQDNEECDGPEPCSQCKFNPYWECTRATQECHSGIAAPELELQDLQPETLRNLCDWAQALIVAKYTGSFGKELDCGNGIRDYVKGFACGTDGTDLIHLDTVAGCHMTVGEVEVCMRGGGGALCSGPPGCDLSLCRFESEGKACASSKDCESNVCCSGTLGPEGTCGYSPCPRKPSGSYCSSPAECEFNYCPLHKCQ